MGTGYREIGSGDYTLQYMIQWLDNVWDSGVVNMFGAADRLSYTFDVKIGVAKKVLAFWCETHSRRKELALLLK
jgi:hypothetical protein